MIYKKLGKIFDPREHSLPLDCQEFSQSPQAIEFDDFIRVYFSTRQLDQDGKSFLSHIAFVEMSKDFKTIQRTNVKPVLSLGSLGSFDEHGVFPLNVLRNGKEIWGYTCGWNRRQSVSVDTAIGLVKSKDGGNTFERIGTGPILGPSLHEPFLVGDGFVIREKNTFHMWYIFGKRWTKEDDDSQPDRVYKIGHATSNDGVHWTKQDGVQIIQDVLGDDECQALPSVMKFHGRYHMVFCYRDVHGFRTDPSKGYRLGYAFSENLKDWRRDDSKLKFSSRVGEWDFEMQCYPHLTMSDGKPYLLYNGNAFGRFGFGAAELLL